MIEHTAPLQPGDHFLKFEIRSLLGRGGHAHVYEGYDPYLDLPVAIKIIGNGGGADRDLVRRAQSEARVLTRLKHDNVVRIYDAGIAPDGLVYIVMEKLEGRTLRDAQRDVGQLTVMEALVVAAQVARGLAAAHAQGAIHRDLKPENIFIEAGNRVKILDFGVAKVVGYAAHTTKERVLHGTLLYMSPEQLQGMGVTPHTDIYALGTVLYEMLCRHPALLGGGRPTTQELGWIQICNVPPMVHDVEPSIPRHVGRFVQQAIMKKPIQRFRSAEEMVNAAVQTAARVMAEAQHRGTHLVYRDLSRRGAPACLHGSVPRRHESRVSAASASGGEHGKTAVGYGTSHELLPGRRADAAADLLFPGIDPKEIAAIVRHAEAEPSSAGSRASPRPAQDNASCASAEHNGRRPSPPLLSPRTKHSVATSNAELSQRSDSGSPRSVPVSPTRGRTLTIGEIYDRLFTGTLAGVRIRSLRHWALVAGLLAGTSYVITVRVIPHRRMAAAASPSQSAGLMERAVAEQGAISDPGEMQPTSTEANGAARNETDMASPVPGKVQTQAPMMSAMAVASTAPVPAKPTAIASERARSPRSASASGRPRRPLPGPDVSEMEERLRWLDQYPAREASVTRAATNASR